MIRFICFSFLFNLLQSFIDIIHIHCQQSMTVVMVHTGMDQFHAGSRTLETAQHRQVRLNRLAAASFWISLAFLPPEWLCAVCASFFTIEINSTIYNCFFLPTA